MKLNVNLIAVILHTINNWEASHHIGIRELKQFICDRFDIDPLIFNYHLEVITEAKHIFRKQPLTENEHTDHILGLTWKGYKLQKKYKWNIENNAFAFLQEKS